MREFPIIGQVFQEEIPDPPFIGINQCQRLKKKCDLDNSRKDLSLYEISWIFVGRKTSK